MALSSGDCPLCSGPLEVRSVAPCEQCGADPDSLARFNAGDQSYHLVKALKGKEMILCTGCMLNFGSLDPSYLGVPAGTSYGFEHMEIVREIKSPVVRADNFCPDCGYRLRFLRFVKEVRSLAAG